jgi:hypothetical protein
MGIESTITPDKLPGPSHNLNDKTWQSWIDKGFEEKVPHHVQALHDRLIKFVTAADDRPIQKKVELMRRVKKDGKEYLVTQFSLHSSNWLGEEVQLYDYVEGYHKEQTLRPKINEKKEIVSYERGTEKEIYSIEFGKKTVDKIIGDQDKATIRFFIAHQGGPQNDYFTYEQFVNNTWDQNQILLLQDGSPQFQPSTNTNANAA